MKTVRKLSREEIKEISSRLGEEKDSKIAEEYDISLGSVYRFRKSMGILAFPDAKKKEPNFNEHCFDEINHISAYWLGFLFSDGCVSETTENRKIISFSLIDEESVIKFSKFIGYKKDIRVGKTPKGNNKTYSVSISNENLYNKLLEYGMKPNKTKTLQKPKINDEFIFSFLCGYFDGDGSISLNKRVNSWKVSFGFASVDFYNWFNFILDESDISYSNEKNRKTKIGNQFYTTCINGVSGKYFLSLCYKNLPESLPLGRKVEKYRELCSVKKFSPPRYKKWEKEILKNNDLDIALDLIKNDIRNYGWVRNRESARKIKKEI